VQCIHIRYSFTIISVSGIAHGTENLVSKEEKQTQTKKDDYKKDAKDENANNTKTEPDRVSKNVEGEEDDDGEVNNSPRLGQLIKDFPKIVFLHQLIFVLYVLRCTSFARTSRCGENCSRTSGK